jgi:polyphosphate kinase 2 (PPK2 family)
MTPEINMKHLKSPEIYTAKGNIRNKVYEKEMARLQVELVKLQAWIKHSGLKVVVSLRGGMPPVKVGQSRE